MTDRATVLAVLTSATKPMWTGEITKAAGCGGDWRDDERIRNLLHRLIADGLLTKSGAYRKFFTPTAQAFIRRGLPVPGWITGVAEPEATDKLFDPAFFSACVHRTIRERGLTQLDAAAAVGISNAAMTMLLNGRNGPSVATFLRLCRWMGIKRLEVDAFSEDPA